MIRWLFFYFVASALGPACFAGGSGVGNGGGGEGRPNANVIACSEDVAKEPQNRVFCEAWNSKKITWYIEPPKTLWNRVEPLFCPSTGSQMLPRLPEDLRDLVKVRLPNGSTNLDEICNFPDLIASYHQLIVGLVNVWDSEVGSWVIREIVKASQNKVNIQLMSHPLIYKVTSTKDPSQSQVVFEPAWFDGQTQTLRWGGIQPYTSFVLLAYSRTPSQHIIHELGHVLVHFKFHIESKIESHDFSAFLTTPSSDLLKFSTSQIGDGYAVKTNSEDALLESFSNMLELGVGPIESHPFVATFFSPALTRLEKGGVTLWADRRIEKTVDELAANEAFISTFLRIFIYRTYGKAEDGKSLLVKNDITVLKNMVFAFFKTLSALKEIDLRFLKVWLRNYDEISKNKSQEGMALLREMLVLDKDFHVLRPIPGTPINYRDILSHSTIDVGPAENCQYYWGCLQQRHDKSLR